MPCFVTLIALLAPRAAILLVALFSDYIGNAFGSLLWPFLGFFFLPLTTLAYAWSVHSYGGVTSLGTIVVILAVLVDVGVLGGARKQRGKARE